MHVPYGWNWRELLIKPLLVDSMRGPHMTCPGKEERASEELKNCFGQVEEAFRPSQVVFRGPHDPHTLIMDGFECQGKT